ncbi:MAG: hydrogenase maturation nickel metallochaperone HypA [Candidatus Thermoplasmatota archaeon]|nr:hydrogenase maturation nickel metallochaperone HypA [Candidatus Thermoplasmatota archaeon]
MHEFSVMSQIIEGLLEESKKWSAVKVEEVFLDLGDFTMLGEEQLKFSYEILSKDTILQGSTLTINHVKGTIECDCGFKGEMSPSEDSPHRIVPILECPKCRGPARIISGRECTIKNLRLVVPDV